MGSRTVHPISPHKRPRRPWDAILVGLRGGINFGRRATFASMGSESIARDVGYYRLRIDDLMGRARRCRSSSRIVVPASRMIRR
jgi:hypothetical protein